MSYPRDEVRGARHLRRHACGRGDSSEGRVEGEGGGGGGGVCPLLTPSSVSEPTHPLLDRLSSRVLIPTPENLAFLRPV